MARVTSMSLYRSALSLAVSRLSVAGSTIKKEKNEYAAASKLMPRTRSRRPGCFARGETPGDAHSKTRGKPKLQKSRDSRTLCERSSTILDARATTPTISASESDTHLLCWFGASAVVVPVVVVVVVVCAICVGIVGPLRANFDLKSHPIIPVCFTNCIQIYFQFHCFLHYCKNNTIGYKVKIEKTYENIP